MSPIHAGILLNQYRQAPWKFSARQENDNLTVTNATGNRARYVGAWEEFVIGTCETTRFRVTQIGPGLFQVDTQEAA